MKKTLYAEDCNYWKSSTTQPDTWIEKGLALIRKMGGVIGAWGFGAEPETNRAAYMLEFRLQGETFKLVWPVLPSKQHDSVSARRQAATMIYHHIKARTIEAQVLGARVAFFQWVKLPDGRAMYQLTDNQIATNTPRLLESK